MANTSRPQGFKPVGQLLRVRPYRSAAAIYPGDPVKLDGGAANATDLQSRVALAAAGDAIIGIAMSYASAAGKEVLVADHPDQLFMAECDGADINENADLSLTINFVAASPDTTYKVSRAVLDSDQTGTTTFPFRLLEISRMAKNEVGSKTKAVVCINNHQLKGGTGTASV